MIICQTIHFMNKYFKFNIGIDLENFNLQKVIGKTDWLQNWFTKLLKEQQTQWKHLSATAILPTKGYFPKK